MNFLRILATLCLCVGIVMVPLSLLVRIVAACFSDKSRELIRKRKIAHTLWLLSSVLIVLTIFSGGGPCLSAALRMRTTNLMAQVQTAIINYQVEYDQLPPGKDNVTLIKELEGDNPRGIAFLTLNPNDQNGKGEMVDAWKTPLRITMTDPKHPVIRSAGPDKIWNTPDDMELKQDTP